jgi:hypothetical protein
MVYLIAATTYLLFQHYEEVWTEGFPIDTDRMFEGAIPTIVSERECGAECESILLELGPEHFGKLRWWSPVFALVARIHQEKELNCPPCSKLKMSGEHVSIKTLDIYY